MIYQKSLADVWLMSMSSSRATHQTLGCITTKERLAGLARDSVEVVAERLVATDAADAILLGVTVRCIHHLLPASQHLVGR